jgi:hypothetical protein
MAGAKNRKSNKHNGGRIARTPRAHSFMVTGESLVVINTIGTTFTGQFYNGLFGVSGAPTYLINTQMLTDIPTYNMRVRKVIVRWLPAGGRSSTIGFGQGASVITNTSSYPSTINPTTIAEYANWKPFYVGKPNRWTWSPITLNDELWLSGGASSTLTTSGEGGGWCFLFNTSCTPLSTIGTLNFTFVLEVRFPGLM